MQMELYLINLGRAFQMSLKSDLLKWIFRMFFAGEKISNGDWEGSEQVNNSQKWVKLMIKSLQTDCSTCNWCYFQFLVNAPSM